MSWFRRNDSDLLREMNERQKRMHGDLHVIIDMLAHGLKPHLSPEQQAALNEIYDRATATREKIDAAQQANMTAASRRNRPLF